MLENFINNWNGDFPNYELKGSDLREPHALMGALVQVFDRLGVDRALLAVRTATSGLHIITTIYYIIITRILY